jgi:UDP-N-acetylglucosamine diphosphorylase / glucose-1-phosphate thymidylyltransferase / UDP-N-acetylgalactosamine diphosphorylase / glucosamine-1-phosphate N-acetyltransferase / galactosamine-1-phosphate N-acetyltransferase
MKPVQQVVIMAAGKSTRTYPLTLTKPKPLLPIANKPILEHTLDQFLGLAEEVILIVGYRQAMIQAHFGDSYQGMRLRYVEQKEQLGTGHAALQAEPYIQDRFILTNGDDLFSRKDMDRCLSHPYATLGKEVDNPEKYGIFILDNHRLIKVVEKSDKPPSKIANTGFYLFDKKIFQMLHKIQKTDRGEYEITDALNLLAEQEKVACELVQNYWLPIGYPWELLNANEYLLANLQTNIQGIVEDRVTIKGAIVIGDGTLIKNGSYLEGPIIIGKNCTIGPNCYIRGATAIGDNCRAGHGVEIKNSLIMRNSFMSHLSYIGDSVLGEYVNIAAGTVTANWRHDAQNVKSVVKCRLIDTGRSKFGAIIGDKVHTGIHTAIYPGRKIWPNQMTLPGQIVKQDIAVPCLL